MATFDERLKELRKEKRLRQDDLAEALNVTKGTVSVWERGVRKPDIKTLETIGEYFEVTVGYLLGIDDARNEIYKTGWGDEAFDEEELEEIALMITRLSRSSRQIVAGTVKAAFNSDKENGQLKPKGSFDVEIKKR